MPYAKGVIDYQFKHYIRTDGMVWFRAEEVPATARMLTILAMYHRYSSGDDAFLLEHFSKAKAVADWLAARRSVSLSHPKIDPRYGIPLGSIEAKNGNTQDLMDHDVTAFHWYASAAEVYRAFTDIGEVWVDIGEKTARADIKAHGADLLKIAPLVYADLHASLNKTVNTSSVGDRCWALAAEPHAATSSGGDVFRGYSAMLYSGALTAQQASDIYTAASGNSTCGGKRFLALGSPGVGGVAMTIATPTSYVLRRHAVFCIIIFGVFFVCGFFSHGVSVMPPAGTRTWLTLAHVVSMQIATAQAYLGNVCTTCKVWICTRPPPARRDREISAAFLCHVRTRLHAWHSHYPGVFKHRCVCVCVLFYYNVIGRHTRYCFPVL